MTDAADRPPQRSGSDAADADTALDHADVEPLEANDEDDLGQPGAPFDRRAPFYVGFVGGLGALLAFWVGLRILDLASVLILIVVSLFLAAGLNPAVEFLQRRGLGRGWAVLGVIIAVLVALGLFFVAVVPVITDQVQAIGDNAPGWLDGLQRNQRVKDLDDEYGIIEKIRDYVTSGDLVKRLGGGVLGVGLAVLSALGNAFIVIVLTLYFLSSLKTVTEAFYRLAPASRRDRVSRLGNRVVKSVGGYVSGAFIVAVAAGLTSLIFLFVVGLGQYAVALAFTVALLDVIPMIGATIGAVLVTAIGFATDPKIGIACIIFYVIYQQVENYLIYPRVMSRSVDVPGSVTVIAALAGATLLGVVGALLAIPTAAAVLLVTREVVIRRQDER